MVDSLRIATRESPLALWQANHIKARLEQLHEGLQVEIIGMTTRGDQLLSSPLAKVGGKGLFVKELELALLSNEADIAVHSMKDVPMHFPEGLELGVICEREDPRDAFVSNHYNSLAELPSNAKVGTCSLRRQCQLLANRRDLSLLDLRGNINTRLRKLDEGQYDAIILAASGLKRMGFDSRITECLPVDQSLPAVGQGALGIETRVDDPAVQALLAPLSHEDSERCVRAERAMNERLNGGCQVPIAGYATLSGEEIHLSALVGASDASQILRTEQRGPSADPEQIGIAAADDLLAQGAGPLLAALYEADNSDTNNSDPSNNTNA